MRPSAEKRYHAFREKYYKNVECDWCGSKVNIHYHHLDPSKKFKKISRMWSYSEAKVKEEVKKCIPLCANCHFLVHRLLGDISQ